jgi:hypothetical protein
MLTSTGGGDDNDDNDNDDCASSWRWEDVLWRRPSGSYDNETPPPEVGRGGLTTEQWTNPIVVQVPPHHNYDRLWEIVDKTGQQRMMKVCGTGRKEKGRRGGITLFNRVIDINTVDIFLIFSIRKVGSTWPPLLKDDSL